MHNAQSVSEKKSVVVTQFVQEIDDGRLREKMELCKRFVVDSQMENGRHRVFNFAMDVLDSHASRKKLDTLLVKLKCAANSNVAFGFLLKNVEHRTCRSELADRNNTMVEQSKLMPTIEDSMKVKKVFSYFNMMAACTKCRLIAKRKF